MRWIVAFCLLLISLGWWSISGREEPPPLTPPTEFTAEVATPMPLPTSASETTPTPIGNAAVPAAGIPVVLPSVSAPVEVVRPTHTVTVVDEHDLPIAGARVVLTDGAEHDLGWAMTDAAGVAALAIAPAANSCRATGFGYWPRAVPLPTGDDPVRIVLQRAARLSGRVFGADERAVAKARTVLLPHVEGRRGMPQLPSGTAVVVSDAEGRFELPFPAAGLHDLIVEAAAHAPFVLQVSSEDLAPVYVRLTAAAAIEGEVLRVDGAPLAQARVEVWSHNGSVATAPTTLGPPRPPLGQPLATAVTDYVGRFTVEGLPPGTSIVALGVESGSTHCFANLIAGERCAVRLQLVEFASLRGRVLEPSGTEVFVYGGTGLARTLPLALDGTFAPQQLPAGRYLVGATTAASAAHLHAVVQEFLVQGRSTLATLVELAPGEQRTIELSVTKVTTGTVAGTAFIGGTPADGCRVAIESTQEIGASRREAAVDAAGGFRVEGVPPGDYDAKLLRRGANEVLVSMPCRVLTGAITQLTLVRP